MEAAVKGTTLCCLACHVNILCIADHLTATGEPRLKTQSKRLRISDRSAAMHVCNQQNFLQRVVQELHIVNMKLDRNDDI